MNASHGHVTPRPDGYKARCGGPAICAHCAAELAQLPSAPPAASVEPCTVYVFLVRRPKRWGSGFIDAVPWPCVFEDRARAENYPHRICEVIEVRLPPKGGSC